jgi:hypothetical protein
VRRGGVEAVEGEVMTTEKTAQIILSSIIVLGFGGVLIAWMLYPPHEQSNIMSALTGALAAGYLQVINYWFGASVRAAATQ